MATQAEQKHAEDQRRVRRAKTRAGRTKPGVAPAERSRDKAHAGKKASYALDESSSKRPSRKSTRKGANRSKPDASLNIREALVKGSPEARYRRARAAKGAKAA